MKPLRAILTVPVVIFFTVAAMAQDSPWPKFRHDSKNTGRTLYTGPVTPTLAWTFDANDGIVSSPVIGSDGTIYVGAGWYFYGTRDSCLYALNPGGSIKWCFKGEDGFFATPIIGPEGTLYVTSLDGYLYAIEDSVTYGKMRWRTYLEYWFNLSSPTLSPDGSTVYAGSPSFYFYSVNTADGAINWKYKTDWCIISSPAIIADGTVYCGSKDHLLRAYSDAREGPIWAARLGYFYDGHLVDCSPAVGADGTIYVGTDQYGAAGHPAVPVDTSFWAISPDGHVKWGFFIGEGVESSPALGLDGTIYFGSYDSCLYAVTDNGTWGALRWKYKTGGPIDGSPTVDGEGTIYIGSRDSILYALRPDGSVKWTYRLNGATECSPTIDGNGHLYIGDFSGRLHVIGTGGPDVGVVAIDLPSLVQPNVIYTPTARINNFRAAGQNFEVSCVIDADGAVVYADTVQVSNYTGSHDVPFTSWLVASEIGVNYTVIVNTILSGDENPDNDRQVFQTSSSAIQYVCGDANGDGTVNIGDAVFLINYIFKGGPSPKPLEAGNANCDGHINIGDAVYIINYIFKGGPAPCCP